MSEQDLDALFDLAPSAFVAARDDLVKRLRAGGERERAQHVAGLRRPTLAAWAANQVARREPALVDAVLDAGADLVREHRRALSGVSGVDVRAAAHRRREAVDAAAAAAARLLAEAGSAPEVHDDRIRSTFEACSLGGEHAEDLRSGRLQRDLPAPAGLGAVGGLALVPSAGGDAEAEPDRQASAGAEGDRQGVEAPAGDVPAPVATRPEPEAAALRDLADEAADAVRAAERRLAAARESATAASARAEAQRAAAQEAADRARAAGEELAAAREREAEARAAAEQGAEEADDSALAAAAAAEELGRAEGDLEAASARAAELDAQARAAEAASNDRS